MQKVPSNEVFRTWVWSPNCRSVLAEAKRRSCIDFRIWAHRRGTASSSRGGCGKLVGGAGIRGRFRQLFDQRIRVSGQRRYAYEIWTVGGALVDPSTRGHCAPLIVPKLLINKVDTFLVTYLAMLALFGVRSVFIHSTEAPNRTQENNLPWPRRKPSKSARKSPLHERPTNS